MTPTLIVELILGILGTGGLVAIFTISEKKTAAMLENMNKANEVWQRIVTQKEKELEIERQRSDKMQTKIDHLYNDNSDLRNALDAVNTECAVCKIMRCDTVACSQRMPPLGKGGDQ